MWKNQARFVILADYVKFDHLSRCLMYFVWMLKEHLMFSFCRLWWVELCLGNDKRWQSLIQTRKVCCIWLSQQEWFNAIKTAKFLPLIRHFEWFPNQLLCTSSGRSRIWRAKIGLRNRQAYTQSAARIPPWAHGTCPSEAEDIFAPSHHFLEVFILKSIDPCSETFRCDVPGPAWRGWPWCSLMRGSNGPQGMPLEGIKARVTGMPLRVIRVRLLAVFYMQSVSKNH